MCVSSDLKSSCIGRIEFCPSGFNYTAKARRTKEPSMKSKRLKSIGLRSSSFAGVIDEKRRIVCFQGASKFFRQVPLDRIEPELKWVGKEMVQLSPKLFEDFL